MREGQHGWILETRSLQVTVRSDGGLCFSDRNGQLLREELPPERRDGCWVHRAQLQTEEHIYGLGERAAPLNRRGASYVMWNQDPGGSYQPGDDPLYICVPVYMGLHKQGCYLVYYENSHPATFAFGEIAEARFEGGPLRYYVIAAPPDQALERYCDLTGRPPLPPRWALGYHQSRWGYKDAAEVRSVIQAFHQHDLPISALHLDLDYMEGYRVFTVNKQRFPDLAGLARELNEQGIHLVTILDPGVKVDPDYPLFRTGIAGKRFCTLPSRKIAQAPVWPGWCAFPDFGDAQTRSWWGTQYGRLLEMGITGFWHDMNEPSAFAAWGEPTLPRCTQHKLESRKTNHREAHNLYGLLMNWAGFDALKKLQGNRRPFILSRSGWAGLQRFAWTWTGDTDSTWDSLRQTIPTVLGLCLSGIPYSGPDIGGFSGNPSAELFVRWFQLATFLPFFRSHSALDVSRREPWCFGSPYLDIVRTFLKLRYQLLPYLYTLAWETSQTGHPLVRPLFWTDSTNPNLWAVDDLFLLGKDLLVAPVMEQGAVIRSVPVPPGHWYSLWDDELLAGPGTFELAAPIERIPLLVRGGSILPLERADGLELHLYPPAETTSQNWEQILYSDAGNNEGDWRLDHLFISRDGDQLDLDWKSDGEFLFPYSEIELVGHGMHFKRAQVDGKEAIIEDNRFRTGVFARASILVDRNASSV
jgi:alpha-glucosidase